MTARVITAIILFALIFWFYFQVDAALDFVRRHAPEPEKTTRIGKVSMTQIDLLCHELIPRMHPPASPLRVLLACRHHKRLVPILFVLASLTGWCASVWLLALQKKAAAIGESLPLFVASLFLALVVGIICYVVLIAPFSFFKGDDTHLENAAAFPLLGGLFMRQFFDRLPELLSAIFDFLTGKRRKKVDGD
jgi:hypothetical protein